MPDWLRDLLVIGGGGFFGGIVSLVFGKGYLERLNKRVEKGESEVKHLRDDNFVKLEKKVDEHIKDDKSQQILTELQSLKGGFGKLGDKMDAVREETAKQGAEIVANGRYIKNLDHSFQSHKREKH